MRYTDEPNLTDFNDPNANNRNYNEPTSTWEADSCLVSHENLPLH
jgi:hypothetical protein